MNETNLEIETKEKNITIKKASQMMGWIVNTFLYNFYKDTFLYSIGVK